MLAFLALASLAMATAPPRVVFDGELVVPRGRARGIPVQIARPTYVRASYDAKAPKAQVRIALMTAADVHAFQEGLPYDMLASTGYADSGEFQQLLMRPGAYFVLVDNRLSNEQSQSVHARVTSAEDPSLPHTLPTARRHAVVAISLTLVAVVAGWSGWRLRRTRLFG